MLLNTNVMLLVSDDMFLSSDVTLLAGDVMLPASDVALLAVDTFVNVYVLAVISHVSDQSCQ